MIQEIEVKRTAVLTYQLTEEDMEWIRKNCPTLFQNLIEKAREISEVEKIRNEALTGKLYESNAR